MYHFVQYLFHFIFILFVQGGQVEDVQINLQEMTRARIGTPYRNPGSLGEVDGCFFVVILLCNIVSARSVSQKKVRKSL